jgi:hypothetical protein
MHPHVWERRNKTADMMGAGMTPAEIAESLDVPITKTRNDTRRIESGYFGEELRERYLRSKRKHQPRASRLIGKALDGIEKQLDEGHERAIGLNRDTGAAVMVTEAVPAKDLAQVVKTLAPLAMGLKEDSAQTTEPGSFDVKVRMTPADMAQVMLRLQQAGGNGFGGRGARTLPSPQTVDVVPDPVEEGADARRDDAVAVGESSEHDGAAVGG